MGVRLLAAGDICPGDHYFSLGHGTGSRLAAGENPLAGIAPLLRQADVTLANLEGPLSSSSTQPPGYEAAAFRGPPGAARLFRDAGIDLLHVANNHVLQHGTEAFRETIAAIDAAGIVPMGLWTEEGVRPVVTTTRGLTLGFLGYSFVPERYLPDQTLYAAATLKGVVADVEELATRVDLVVVSVHWGSERTAWPDRDVVGAAHSIVASGATVVLGHHPHWFQPVERVGPALIAYSLGDLVFDLFWDRRSVESALLSVELDKGGVVGYSLVPVRFDRGYRLRRRSGPAARRFLAELEGGEPAREAGEDQPRTWSRTLEVVAKLIYFLSVAHRGDTARKLRFVLAKGAAALRAGFDRLGGGSS